MRPMKEEGMSTDTQLGHNPRPAVNNLGRCAVCNRRIKQIAGTRRWSHNEPRTRNANYEWVGFDASREKELYERLDAITGGMRDPRLILPELFELLGTMYDWRMSPQVW